MEIGKDEWQNAFVDLARGTFGLYLYLGGNMDGYRFGLSSFAFLQATGVSDITYRRAVEEMLGKDFLIKKGEPLISISPLKLRILCQSQVKEIKRKVIEPLRYFTMQLH